MLKRIREMFKNEKGLTLVELLAVIVILAIVGAIAFVFIGGIIDNSKKDAHIANAQQVINAAKLYEATEGDPSDKTAQNLIDGNYLEVEPLDPWDKDVYNKSDVLEKAKITIEDNKFVINNFAANKADNCNIVKATEQQLLKGDRKALCGDD